MPLHLTCTFVVLAFFMLREVEASHLKWRHAELDIDGLSVTLTLPVSKADLRAAAGRGAACAHLVLVLGSSLAHFMRSCSIGLG